MKEIEELVSALRKRYEGELAVTKRRRASVSQEHEQFYAGKQAGLEDALYWLLHLTEQDGEQTA